MVNCINSSVFKKNGLDALEKIVPCEGWHVGPCSTDWVTD